MIKFSTLAANLPLNESMLVFSYLFIFNLFTVDLSFMQKKLLYVLYSNIIELIDVNSVTEQEIESFPKEFLESLSKRSNLSRKNFSNQCDQPGRHTHIFHTLIKETLRGKPPFLCSEFSGVHCRDPTCCRNILQS